MSAQPQPWVGGLPRNSRNDVQRIDSQQRVVLCDIALQAVIRADVRRVCHAVNMPEYREAWLCAPDGRGYCCATGGQADNGYRIDFYRSGFLDVSVSGSYQVCRPDEIVFTWQKNSAPETTASLVSLHLQGDSSRAVLNLRHSGIASASEHLWHQRMWCRSLEKLAWLMERCQPVTTAAAL
jgi:uncharacterized protein YndB with AHSA1/START domain